MKDAHDLTPSVGSISWDITPDLLMATAERHWPAVEIALRELEAERRAERAVSHREAVRRIVEDLT